MTGDVALAPDSNEFTHDVPAMITVDSDELNWPPDATVTPFTFTVYDPEP